MTQLTAKRSRPKQDRLSVVLSKQGRERIDRLVEMMDAESQTEVTKDAFRLLEYMLNVSQDGGKFFIQMPGEEMTRVEIFGVSTQSKP